MGNDGIIYKVMKRVHPKTKTPLIATLLSGFLAGLMALIFNLHQLIDMMSIGTLLAFYHLYVYCRCCDDFEHFYYWTATKG